jgi:hypothetical protein
VKPKEKLGKRAVVVVHLSPPANAFKLTRFSPEKNNVRPNWYFKETGSMEEGKKMFYKKYFLKKLEIIKFDLFTALNGHTEGSVRFQGFL